MFGQKLDFRISTEANFLFRVMFVLYHLTCADSVSSDETICP